MDDDDIDDLGMIILSDECELVENTIKIMKDVWTVIIMTGIFIYVFTM
jgi:hypothetical protein